MKTITVQQGLGLAGLLFGVVSCAGVDYQPPVGHSPEAIQREWSSCRQMGEAAGGVTTVVQPYRDMGMAAAFSRLEANTDVQQRCLEARGWSVAAAPAQ